MQTITEHLAVLTVDLHIPDAASLKDKRKVIKSLKDRIRNKFNVSISEIRGHDKWQRCTLGFAMIGTDSRYMNGCLQNIVSYIDQVYNVEICDQNLEFVL